jgi:DNA-binding SARP family transcriptional activator
MLESASRSRTWPLGAAYCPASVQVCVLQHFQVVRDGRRLPLAPAAQRLIAFLSLNNGTLLRTFVAGSLWPENGDKEANACLRSALWRLQREGRDLVRTTRTQIGLHTSVSVDMYNAIVFAEEILEKTRVNENLRDTQTLLLFDLLPDWYDDWVVVKREWFRQLRLRALDKLCELLAAAGRYRQAVDVGLAAVECEPLRETAHRAIINAHLAEGNRNEALRQYRWYRQLLWTELGADPSPQIAQLVAPLERLEG